MRRLLLMRHAEAEPGHGRPDRDRRLTAKGQADATRVGEWLAAQGLRPDLVVASPAPRALHTAQRVAAAVGPGTAVREDAALYEAGAADLLRWLAVLPPQAACVLVVAHNPAVEQVALHLTGDDDLAATGMRPGTLFAIALPDDWEDLGARSSPGWTRVDP